MVLAATPTSPRLIQNLRFDPVEPPRACAPAKVERVLWNLDPVAEEVEGHEVNREKLIPGAERPTSSGRCSPADIGYSVNSAEGPRKRRPLWNREHAGCESQVIRAILAPAWLYGTTAARSSDVARELATVRSVALGPMRHGFAEVEAEFERSGGRQIEAIEWPAWCLPAARRTNTGRRCADDAGRAKGRAEGWEVEPGPVPPNSAGCRRVSATRSGSTRRRCTAD